ncbi:hypothetical protein PY793_09600 [Acetobacter fabarum]|uniref:hypothetical protein n=1 Tax=Acetobacter fabarum TaxID=483199 RepID=UPI00312BA3C5
MSYFVAGSRHKVRWREPRRGVLDFWNDHCGFCGVVTHKGWRETRLIGPEGNDCD